MKNNIVTYSVLGLGAIMLYNVASKYSKLASNVEIVTLKMPEVDVVAGGLRIRYYAAIKNPTRETVNLQIPQITLYDKNGGFLSQTTKVYQSKYTVKPLAITPLETKEFIIDWSTMLKISQNFSIPNMPTSWLDTVLNTIFKAFDYQKLLAQVGLNAKVQMYINNKFIVQNFKLF